MVETLEDLPEGVIGFRMSGEVTAEDYKSALEPALRGAVESGEVRSVFVIDDDFDMAGGALFEDMKTGFELGVGHLSAWKRTAVATDKEWVRKAMNLFGWMSPGEVKLFSVAELEEAKTWAAG